MEKRDFSRTRPQNRRGEKVRVLKGREEVICYFREANKRSIDKSWRKWPYTGPEEEQFTWREIDSAKAMRIT